jgi:ATP-binding cassette, subfamily B, bacterial CvaB/MchF/RaxB
MSSLLDRLHFGFKRKPPVYLQTHTTECGLICVAMAMAYFGDEPDLSALRMRFRPSLKGTSLDQLMSMCASVGLSGRALRFSRTDLYKLRLPCILHWNEGHFVLLVKANAGAITIHDPSVGKRECSMEEALTHTNGIALEIQPVHEFSDPEESSKSVKRQQMRLWGLVGKVHGLRASMLSIFAMGLGIEVLVLSSPWFIQWLTDHAILTRDKNLVVALSLGFGFIVVVRAFLDTARAWAIAVMSAGFNLQWMNNVFSHLLRLPILYYERRHLGDILSRFGVIQTVQNTLTTSFIEAIVDGVLVVGAIGFMLLYSPALTMPALSAMLIYVIARSLLYSALKETSHKRIVQDAQQQSLFLESVRSIVSLRMHNREEIRTAQWLNQVVRMKNSHLAQQRYGLIFRFTNTLVFGVVRVWVLAWAAYLVMQGSFSVGMLLAFAAYFEIFSARVTNLVDRLFELKLLEIQGMRLADIVLFKPEQDTALKRDLPQIPLDVPIAMRWSGLKLRFAETEPFILENCSLTLPPQQHVAIMGAPGSGKTSLIKTALGLFPNSRGEVFIAGVSMKKLGLHNYREIVCGVFHDERPMAGTVAENIFFFSPEPDLHWMQECAKLTGLHEDINTLPMRYQTLVGDLGMALTSSQRQKLLITRALYRKPKILLLDEAMSHLGKNAVQKIFTAMKSRQCSVVYTTSRQEDCAYANQVYLLQAGSLQQSLQAVNPAPSKVSNLA